MARGDYDDMVTDDGNRRLKRANRRTVLATLFFIIVALIVLVVYLIANPTESIDVSAGKPVSESSNSVSSTSGEKKTTLFNFSGITEEESGESAVIVDNESLSEDATYDTEIDEKTEEAVLSHEENEILPSLEEIPVGDNELEDEENTIDTAEREEEKIDSPVYVTMEGSDPLTLQEFSDETDGETEYSSSATFVTSELDDETSVETESSETEIAMISENELAFVLAESDSETGEETLQNVPETSVSDVETIVAADYFAEDISIPFEQDSEADEAIENFEIDVSQTLENNVAADSSVHSEEDSGTGVDLENVEMDFVRNPDNNAVADTPLFFEPETETGIEAEYSEIDISIFPENVNEYKEVVEYYLSNDTVLENNEAEAEYEEAVTADDENIINENEASSILEVEPRTEEITEEREDFSSFDDEISQTKEVEDEIIQIEESASVEDFIDTSSEKIIPQEVGYVSFEEQDTHLLNDEEDNSSFGETISIERIEEAESAETEETSSLREEVVPDTQEILPSDVADDERSAEENTAESEIDNVAEAVSSDEIISVNPVLHIENEDVVSNSTSETVGETLVIRGKSGSAVKSVSAGTVIETGKEDGRKYVIVLDDSGSAVKYSGFERVIVKAKAKVKKGTVLGSIGSSSASTVTLSSVEVE